jgi:hypothetical protein
MKFNLKNPLWKTEPNYCKAGLEQELRVRYASAIPKDNPNRVQDFIKELLGEN